MLNIRKVLGAKPKEHVEAELAELLTPWGEQLDRRHVLEEHPTPQLEREVFQVLNGPWDCAFAASGHDPAGDLAAVCAAAPMPAEEAFDAEIVVPFSPEAPLSGVRRQLQPDELLWYRRSLMMPELGMEGRCLLHFQAVDHACALRVNGRLVGTHVGGYDSFTFDITEFLEEGSNDLMLCVADPSEFGGQPRGKQRFDRGDIWYSAQSGIWQTVWLEVVPAEHIVRLQIEPDAETGILVVGVECSNDEIPPRGNRLIAGRPSKSRGEYDDETVPPRRRLIRMKVFDAEGELVASGKGRVENGTGAVAVHVPDVRKWSPDDPCLYKLRLTLGDDVVRSYCGFRTVEMRRDDAGVPRVFLNGEPLFVRGVLDQAYWPDGLLTAPSDEALVFDIEAMREAGFNLMRKHIKVECARWYYHCDRLGMLVLQDMVQGGEPEIRSWDWSYKPTLFKASWNRFRDDTPAHWARLGAGGATGARYRDEWVRLCRVTVRELGGHPCIIGWSLFNEGWGQFCAREACALVRRLDPTRVVDAVSGWYDQACGDFHSVHNYFRELEVWPCKHGRAFFVSEFGGFSHRVEGHSSLSECYGYEVYDDLDEWRVAVPKLLAHMNALESRGLAGYVYTQVSDIEEETNGLLTYDRRVRKLG